MIPFSSSVDVVIHHFSYSLFTFIYVYVYHTELGIFELSCRPCFNDCHRDYKLLKHVDVC